MCLTKPFLSILLLLVSLIASCERDTRLRIEGVNPPRFFMTGSGELTMLRLHGPKVREGHGETSFIIWEIQPAKGSFSGAEVEALSPITYGQVPKGYVQVYPEDGSAPPAFVEGQDYDLWIDTDNANGIRMIFTIRHGEIVKKSG